MGLFDTWDDIFNEEYEKMEEFMDIEGFNELFIILKNLRHNHSILSDLSEIREVDTKAELHEVDIGKKNLSFILNAKKAFGIPFILNLPPLTNFISYKHFEALHVLVEAIYVNLSKHRLTDKEYASIYLSDICKQLTFNIIDFDKGFKLLDIDEIEFFNKLKKTYYLDKRAEKLDKIVYNHFASLAGESERSFSANFTRVIGFSQNYLSACIAVKNGRGKITCEDLVIAFLAVFKLINYDIRDLIPLVSEDSYKI